MKPALPVKPVPKPPKSKPPVTPQDEVVMRNKGHCLYDLQDLFGITLISVSNVSVADSMVSSNYLHKGYYVIA